MKVGDKYIYSGKRTDYCDSFVVVKINPLYLHFEGRKKPDGPYSPESLPPNYKLSDISSVTNILKTYE